MRASLLGGASERRAAGAGLTLQHGHDELLSEEADSLGLLAGVLLVLLLARALSTHRHRAAAAAQSNTHRLLFALNAALVVLEADRGQDADDGPCDLRSPKAAARPSDTAGRDHTRPTAHRSHGRASVEAEGLEENLRAQLSTRQPAACRSAHVGEPAHVTGDVGHAT